jgi:hypothetical protein
MIKPEKRKRTVKAKEVSLDPQQEMENPPTTKKINDTLKGMMICICLFY